MTDYYADLHIHSCLSPCAEDDMTPANIAGMASVNGLTLVALTDHNTAKNCPAFFAQCRKLGIVPVPGMELTTAEDIHVVCLFRELSDAMEFDGFVDSRRIKIGNKPEVFGNQFIMDENDEIVGEEEYILFNATDLSIEDAYREVEKRGGACFPAHIDRTSNGMIATLGDFPPEPPFTAYELNDGEHFEEYREKYPIIKGLCHTVSSDAHNLWSISDGDEAHRIALDDEDYSSSKVRNKLIDYLCGKGEDHV